MIHIFPPENESTLPQRILIYTLILAQRLLVFTATLIPFSIVFEYLVIFSPKMKMNTVSIVVAIIINGFLITSCCWIVCSSFYICCINKLEQLRLHHHIDPKPAEWILVSISLICITYSLLAFITYKQSKNDHIDNTRMICVYIVTIITSIFIGVVIAVLMRSCIVLDYCGRTSINSYSYDHYPTVVLPSGLPSVRSSLLRSRSSPNANTDTGSHVIPNNIKNNTNDNNVASRAPSFSSRIDEIPPPYTAIIIPPLDAPPSYAPPSYAQITGT